MIIEARGDVVTLRGTLNENHWDAIAAAVDLLLPDHPLGILMDCSGVSCMTDMGGATFMDGLSYMEAHGARIILCSVPEAILDRIKAIPGLHSQVPTAPTVEDGRKSLDAGKAAPLISSGKAQVILVPVNAPFSVDAASQLLARLQLGPTTELHFIYVIVVPRSLPVGAPLPEDEAQADRVLSLAERVVAAPGRARHIIRGRGIADAIVDAAAKLKASEVIAGLTADSAGDDAVSQIMVSLREKCPCDLTVTQERSETP